jgi:Domain of unknown function (DUF4399)
MDLQHVHFGGGQTETTLTLAPGQHTLQLVLGDWSHVPFSPPIMSPVITIRVKQQSAAAQRAGTPTTAGCNTDALGISHRQRRHAEVCSAMALWVSDGEPRQ